MKTDKEIFFLTADMGINLVEKIENDYPDRFLNVGIAEQNLIGVASGLINTGFKVVVYTISNFLVFKTMVLFLCKFMSMLSCLSLEQQETMLISVEESFSFFYSFFPKN